MVLVFYNELPPGNKFVTFFSSKRNNSITVDTTQENAMVLYALIPSEYWREREGEGEREREREREREGEREGERGRERGREREGEGEREGEIE